MVELIVTPSYTTLRGLPLNMVQILDDTLRYLSINANAYNPAFVRGRWDGYVRLFDRHTMKFPTGLTPRVIKLLQSYSLETTITKKTNEKQGTTTRKYTPPFPLRPYQIEAVEAAIKWKRGVLSIPTGGGKTEVAQAVLAEYNAFKNLFLVPSRALLHQTARRFKQAFPESNIIVWGDGKKLPKQMPEEYILIATVQTAFKEPNEWLAQTQLVFIDECQHAPADTFKRTIEFCKNAESLIGLSATPFRNDNADLELEGWTGPIIYKVDYEHLISNGWLVPPVFSRVRTLRQALLDTRGLKTMIFSEKIKDLELAAAVFDEFNVTIVTSKTKDVEGVLDKFRNGEITHIAATPMFDEGLDIPDIEAVVFFATGASRTRAIQRIGRAMRPAKGKKDCKVIDLFDSKYFDRLEAYNKEPAFKRRVAEGTK